MNNTDILDDKVRLATRCSALPHSVVAVIIGECRELINREMGRVVYMKIKLPLLDATHDATTQSTHDAVTETLAHEG